MEQLDYSKLLDNYYEGLTSLDEEKLLKNYLMHYEGNNSNLLEAKTLFCFIDIEKTETLKLDFDNLFVTKQPSKIRKLLIYAGSLAAAAVILLSVNYIVNVLEKPVIYAYINGEPITKKDVALEYSKQAMLHLTIQLNKGTEGLSCMRTLNKPVEILTLEKR